jgi:hypothetical protein
MNPFSDGNNGGKSDESDLNWSTNNSYTPDPDKAHQMMVEGRKRIDEDYVEDLNEGSALNDYDSVDELLSMTYDELEDNNERSRLTKLDELPVEEALEELEDGEDHRMAAANALSRKR